MFKEKFFLLKLKRKRNYENRIINNKALYLDRNERFIDIPDKLKLWSKYVQLSLIFMPNSQCSRKIKLF